MKHHAEMFQPGWKGGPGRPKGSKKPEWVNNFDEEGPLVKIASDPKHRNHFDALKLICAYKFGQPAQTIASTLDIQPTGRSPIEIINDINEIVGGRMPVSLEPPGGAPGNTRKKSASDVRS